MGAETTALPRKGHHQRAAHADAMAAAEEAEEE
jgi:hypothetical protein